MDIWGIIKSVGGAVVRNAVPGGGLIVDAVNALLPDDAKLPADATGHDIKQAVKSLPPEQRAAIEQKRFDVEIAQIQQENSTVRAMLEADTKTPHTTRPYIAKGSFLVVAWVTVTVIALWSYAIATGDEGMVSTVMDGWQFVLAVIGPLVTLLWAYFGVLKHEHRNRLTAAVGHPPAGGLGSIVSALLKR